MKKCSFIPMLFVFLFSWISSSSQTSSSLPHSSPESQGVSSSGIIHFLEAAAKTRNELHSFIFLRHGKVIAEGWWDPYNPGLRHTLYSASKTFTSTAVGFAVSENRLKLSDKVISFFPKDLPDTLSSNLSALTLRDMLIMSDGMDPEPTYVAGTTNNWVKGFLAAPVKYKPGAVFLYNSLGTFMLSAIVQKVTGQKVVDYLKPRLFDPLGISGMDWEENMMGINTGGWGLRIRTEDMAKMGQLYLQKGQWNGNQVLPAAWIEEATKEKIFRHPDMPQAARDTSDWEQGYGYQIWRSRHHSYRADGAFGQFILVLPDQDAVIAILSETPSMQNELNLVWDFLLPAIKKDKLPADPKSEYTLKAKLANLALAANPGSATSYAANKGLNKYFVLEPNANHIANFTIQVRDSICHLIMNTGNDTYELQFGHGFWKKAQTNKPGPYSVSSNKENWAILSPYKVAGNFYWKDDQTLVLQLRYIESPHTEIYTIYFDGKQMTMDIERSFDYGSKKITLSGVQK
jgi:CubicO group peptidase (beta-lactamase class C family)